MNFALLNVYAKCVVQLRGLSSLQTVLKTSNQVFGDSNTMKVTNDSAALSFFSRMFCGQESTIFGKMEGARSLMPQIQQDEEDLKYNYDYGTSTSYKTLLFYLDMFIQYL